MRKNIDDYYEGCRVPEGKKVTCQICSLGDHTGTYYPTDLDDNYHIGFTIGKGKAMYWMMTWHSKSGNVTVFRSDTEGNDLRPRWIPGDSLITIHFK